MEIKKYGIVYVRMLILAISAGIFCGCSEIIGHENETEDKAISGKNVSGKTEAEAEVMPVKDVKAGMKGYGLTVYRGAEPEKFYFEVLGVKHMLLGSVTKLPVVIAKLTGGPSGFSPEKTGVVAGMSGSPMYIGGKLVGALAYGFTIFAKDPICGIQPAETMLNPQIGSMNKAALGRISGKHIPLVLTMPESLAKLFSGSGKNSANEKFFADNFIIQSAVGSADHSRLNTNLQLKPGSSIAVYIVRGDISLAATGTVTMVFGNKIYAFGHPFFGDGKTEMPFHQNEIITINTSLMDSSKMSGGDVGTAEGTITNDYHAAIFGRIGQPAQAIAVKLTANGAGGNRTINMEFARSPALILDLISFILPQIIRNMYEEVGYAGAGVKQYVSMGTDIIFSGKTQALRMEKNFNIFNGDIARSMWDYGDMLEAIVSNLEKKNALDAVTGINVRIAFAEGPAKEPGAGVADAAKIIGLSSDDKAIPGQTLKADMRLSFEKGNETIVYTMSVPVQIPADTELGGEKIELTVGSGFDLADSEDVAKMDLGDMVVYYNTLFRPGLFLAMRYSVKQENEAKEIKEDKVVEFGSIASNFIKEIKRNRNRKMVYSIPLPAVFDSKTDFSGIRQKRFNVTKAEEQKDIKAQNNKIQKKPDKEKQDKPDQDKPAKNKPDKKKNKKNKKEKKPHDHD